MSINPVACVRFPHARSAASTSLHSVPAPTLFGNPTQRGSKITSPSRDIVPEPTIDADLLRIPVGPGAVHVERYGHGGPAVVLLHGFGTSSFLWRIVGPALAIARRSAFAIDLLGYGESDRPFGEDFGIAAQSEYLDRAMTALRLPRATLVGVDVGAGVALRLAATRPERVDRLILVNPVAFDELPSGDVKAMQRNTARFALQASRGVLGAAPLLSPVLEGGVADPAHMPQRLVARYLAPYVGKDGVSHLLVLGRSIRADDLEDLDLERIVAPTLIVWGERDGWSEPSLPDRLATAIRHSRLVRVETAARLVPEDEPDRLAELIIDFTSQPSR
jgi:pimeloyl-ACP methyl ester carboxylesterase